MNPAEAQIEVMETLARATGAVNREIGKLEDGGLDEFTVRAALMVVLWRVLRVPGSRAVIVAPSEGPGLAVGELGRLAIAFLSEVCKTRDSVLSSITTLRTARTLEFGSEPGWEIRLVPNASALVAEYGRRSLTALVLDAGSVDPHLCEAQRELESVASEPRGLLIRLW
jgi:hypothetical protein